MKKILIIIIFFIFCVIYGSNEYIVNEDEIRFRVIANSNNVDDIIMKEKVVDELSNIIFKDGNRDSIKQNIINNLSTMENKIDSLFENNNYNKSYNIIYGLNEFPKKEYNGKVYNEGLYESLVVEIGEAKGNNYWCFLYPSLCVSDYENKKLSIEEKEENIKIKFKFIEILKDIF